MGNAMLMGQGGKVVQEIVFDNLTHFKIHTIDNVDGSPVVGINITITGTPTPETTNYTTNSKGYLSILLQPGSYTLTVIDDIVGYNKSDISFSSQPGETFKEVSTIFVRPTTTQVEIDVSKTLVKAPYIKNMDIFVVGGGGAGGSPNTSGTGNYRAGGGGGGGYTTTVLNKDVTTASTIPITVGAGGVGVSRQDGGNGGTTSCLDVVALGGFGGKNGDAQGVGGAGGSGGGGIYTGNGGSDGSNGTNGTSGYSSAGGVGQGTTTRAFGVGTIYSGGGGGGNFGVAGPGGGRGDDTAPSSSPDTACHATSYGGGGGGGYGNSSYRPAGGNGYKGLIVLRW